MFTKCMTGVLGGKKRVLTTLELELRMIVNRSVWAGNWTWVFLTAKLCLQHFMYSYNEFPWVWTELGSGLFLTRPVRWSLWVQWELGAGGTWPICRVRICMWLVWVAGNSWNISERGSGQRTCWKTPCWIAQSGLEGHFPFLCFLGFLIEQNRNFAFLFIYSKFLVLYY